MKKKELVLIGVILIVLLIITLTIYKNKFVGFALEEGDDSSVTRSFSNSSYVTGDSIIVQLSVFIDNSFIHQAYLMEEIVPVGINITNTGGATQVDNVLRWGSLSPTGVESVDIIYEVSIPESAGTGILTFGGSYGFDGSEEAFENLGEKNLLYVGSNSVNETEQNTTENNETIEDTTTTTTSSGGGGGGSSSSSSSSTTTTSTTEDKPKTNYSEIIGDKASEILDDVIEKTSIKDENYTEEANNFLAILIAVVFISICIITFLIIRIRRRHKRYKMLQTTKHLFDDE